MTIASLRQRLNENIWLRGLDDAPFYKSWPLKALRLTLAVVRDMQEENLSLRATSLVYTTLLSLVPLLAISFSVLKGFGIEGQITPFLHSFLEPLGDQSGDIADHIVGFVDKIQVGVLGALGFALLVYSVISLMHKIEQSFNYIWRLPEARSFLTRVRDYLGVLLVGPLFIFLSIAITASLRHDWFQIEIIDTPVRIILEIVPYILFALAFAAVYMFLPNTRVRPLPALGAGLITGVLWKILGKLFGVFVAGSASYAAIYSAFAALVLFMIWIYTGWLIVLAGAAACYYIQNPSNQSMSRSARRMSVRVREKLALQVTAEIGAAFYNGKPGLTAAQLARRLKLPAISIEEIAEELARAGIFVHTDSAVPEYIPAKPFDATSVDDMLKALRQADESLILSDARLSVSPAVEAVLKKADALTKRELGNITLKQLSLGSIDT